MGVMETNFFYDSENKIFHLGQWDCYKISNFFHTQPKIVQELNNVKNTNEKKNKDENESNNTNKNNNNTSSTNPLKASQSFQAILDWMNHHETDSFHASTQLMIRPGYKFAMCDALMTNFHQPKSTLLLLVSALLGSKEKTMEVYDYALRQDFRFLSYGDSSILL